MLQKSSNQPGTGQDRRSAAGPASGRSSATDEHRKGDDTRSGEAVRQHAVAAFWEMLKTFPALVLSLATVPLVFLLVAFGGGVTLLNDVWTAVRQGEPAAIAAVMLGLVYALVCTIAVAMMEGTIERRRERNVQNSNSDTIQEAVADMRREVASISQRQGVADERSEYVVSTLSSLARKLRTENVMRPNVAECWTDFIPGSEYVSVGRKGVRDLIPEISARGEVTWTPDLDRIRTCWLPRFAAGTAVGKAVFVIYVDPTAQGCPEAVRKYLLLFRALEQMAQSKRIKLHLDRARFLLKESTDTSPELSFFIGRQKVNGIDTPFVNSYVDFESMFDVRFLDDVVYTSYNPGAVDAMHKAYRAIASTCSGHHTLDDLEKAFGGFVEPAEIPSLATQAAEWGVENGDHFTI